MTWITRSDDEKSIIEEIEKQTDRSSAIIAAAYMEERLLLAIKARLNSDKKVEDVLFRNSGPLGTFSSKIDLGFLLGVFTARSHKILHTIREIRNEFAHDIRTKDFNSQRIADLCKNISFSCEYGAFNKTTNQEHKFALQPDGTPRTSFINAIKYLLFILELETKNEPLRKPAPPVVAD